MLGTVSGSTKFIQGGTSNQQLAVKILDKNSKACIHKKYSKQTMFKRR